jgi:hypothetical protein
LPPRPAQVGVDRPISQKNYRDVATLGYAAAAQRFAFTNADLLRERLTWLSGRDLSMAGSPAGFITDPVALLGTALGRHAVADRAFTDRVAGWMDKFAGDSFGGTRVPDREKCLVAAALRLVGSTFTAPLPTAESRVILPPRDVKPFKPGP